METNPFGLTPNSMEEVLQGADAVFQMSKDPTLDDNHILATLLGVAKAARERGWTFDRAVLAVAFTYGRTAQVIHIPGAEAA